MQKEAHPEGERPMNFLLIQRERERVFYFNYPQFFVGPLQPLQADWKGRPQCVCCLSASVQFSLLGLCFSDTKCIHQSFGSVSAMSV